jgi:hypothetical protein
MLGLLALALALALAQPPAPPAVPTPDGLVLRMLDGEGLYTVGGGLKPVSEGFWQTRFAAAAPDLSAVEQARRALAAARLGDTLYADVLVFRRAFGGKKFAAAYVAHRPALRRLIASDPPFWAGLGVTPSSHPAEVMPAAEGAPDLTRARALGDLFGYPRHAVRFFVAATFTQGYFGTKLVPRDFVHLPTFGGEKGRFVYAVPKGHRLNEADDRLRAAAAPILAEYRRRRVEAVGDGKPGAAALLRDWHADGFAVGRP